MEPVNTAIERCQIISLPRVEDGRGNLTFIESGRHLDFDIKRVYYLYDVPGGAARGGHAHKTLGRCSSRCQVASTSSSIKVAIASGFISIAPTPVCTFPR